MSIIQQGAFHTKEYRNLFKELGYPEADIDARLERTWTDLFYGAPDVRIYYPLGNDKGYILDTGNLDVRTEGMSYGMMMAVQMNKKKSLTGCGTSRRRLCSIEKAVTPITLPGIASLTVPASPRGPRRTGKNISQWPCFSPQAVGETGRNLITIPSRRERFCVHACIRVKPATAIRCGTRKRS